MALRLRMSFWPLLDVENAHNNLKRTRRCSQRTEF